ncbi:MAG: Terminase-like family protein [Ruminococcaceae bacterium]|nr:Terminase-like family protein [Oscillospiraceae bacterium]
MKRCIIGIPNQKQRLFLTDTHRHIAFGGARGGGKSWAVRTKAKLLCFNYPGIRVLIVRRTFPELYNNHINILRRELFGFIKYNDREKLMTFENSSTISFSYCANDSDLDRLQGVEYDVIFLDEATQLSEFQMRAIVACVRAVNSYPKRVYYTCNPGGQGHSYIKRLFIDRRYETGERAEDYFFIQSLVTDNTALMEADPDYIRQLEALPKKLRDAWRYGDWNIFEGQFFEEFRDDPDHYDDRRFTHVIKAFDIPFNWNIYRSYDFGYNKPFSCAWWAVDFDGVVYRILELYGCTSNPNEGVKWTPDRQFEEIARIEREHPWLKGRSIQGVADPSIWDTSRGDSVADTAARYGIYFAPGDNKRIAGWMQLHYRLCFDSEGYPMMYIFENCKGFIRTLPLLSYSETNPEDLDSSLEDHCADEARYFCMMRPITPRDISKDAKPCDDPLDLMTTYTKNRMRRI